MDPVQTVDWSMLPAPHDDGACDHLTQLRLPSIQLPATVGGPIDPGQLDGTVVIYVYPMTGRPDRSLPSGWNDIPGARGCTPQSCAFRDHYQELRSAGATHVFGPSNQSPEDQREAADRLHMPFPLLSDADGQFAGQLRLPSFEADGQRRLKRVTLITRDGAIVKIFYPVFPPDRNAEDVLNWLKQQEA
ncbi:peroxiredoxin [Roseibium aquae]|uniref:Peroxiredoxin n=1 Tax=Roseibium aquae TaxID=1323746 RepID=A0A916TIR1_9HYPH|nr:peroxiredoxin [Roseibium aquae]GGB47042.1 peroxiredoxin [Roseibium aquae]